MTENIWLTLFIGFLILIAFIFAALLGGFLTVCAIAALYEGMRDFIKWVRRGLS